MDIRDQIIAKQIALINALTLRMDGLKLKPTPSEIELTDELHDLYDTHEATEALADFDANGGTSLEDLKRELEME